MKFSSETQTKRYTRVFPRSLAWCDVRERTAKTKTNKNVAGGLTIGHNPALSSSLWRLFLAVVVVGISKVAQEEDRFAALADRTARLVTPAFLFSFLRVSLFTTYPAFFLTFLVFPQRDAARRRSVTLCNTHRSTGSEKLQAPISDVDTFGALRRARAIPTSSPLAASHATQLSSFEAPRSFVCLYLPQNLLLFLSWSFDVSPPPPQAVSLR